MKKRMIIALGGNAILNKGEEGTFDQQYSNVYKTVENLVPVLSNSDNEVAITHGNGPQVGNLLIQQDSASDKVAKMPMFVCGSMTQGQIGFFMQNAITKALADRGESRQTATIITQVEVPTDDPGFVNPTKPVGPFYTKEEFDEMIENTDNTYKEDAGRGYRRVVASPKPIAIVELEYIRESLEADNITICVGGGGIPVVKEGKAYKGVDAVIDKDRASALLADNLKANVLIILTAVDKAYKYFGTDKQEEIDSLNLEEAAKLLEEGHFAEGSMKPKVEAIMSFIKGNKDRSAIITSPAKLQDALEGKNGTHFKA